MNTKFFKLAAVVLLLAGTTVACESKEKTNENPLEIPFVEYLFPENCQWKNLTYDNKLIVINSNADLEKYIKCTQGSYPEIDFFKNTLLQASGGGGDIRRVEIQFLKNNDEYTLKVTLHAGIAAVALTWNAVVLVPKISNNAIIKLEIEQTYN